MHFIDRIVVAVLGVAAVAALGLGIFQIAMAQGPTYRYLSDVQAVLKSNIRSADRAVDILASRREALPPLQKAAADGTDALQNAPVVMGRLARLLDAVQNTLGESAESLRHLEQKTGFLTPGDRITTTSEAIDHTAAEMRDLRNAIRATKASADALREHAAEASTRLVGLRAELRSAGIGPGHLASRIRRMRELAERGDIAKTIAWQQSLTGGLFIGLGLVLAALSGLWWRLPLRGRDLRRRETS